MQRIHSSIHHMKNLLGTFLMLGVIVFVGCTTGCGQKIAPNDTTPSNTTMQTPPDDYYGDPLYWIPGIEYETLHTTAGDLSSDPVIPKEKRDRINNVHNLRWREGSRHLTQEQRDQIAVEILAEGMQPLDVAKFIVVTGYWDEKYASEYAQQAIEEAPDNFDAHVILTQLQPLSADKIVGYRRLLDWNSSSLPVLLGLGVSVKDHREAIDYLKKVAQLSPNYLNGSALGKLGVRYQKIGDYDKALAALKKAYAINPSHSYREQIEAIERGTPLYIKEDR